MHHARGWARRSRCSLVVLLLLGLASTSCRLVRGSAPPPISSLVVRNHSFFDVNIYAIAAGGEPRRLGTVVGNTSSTFPLHIRDLQASNIFAVRLHAIGSASSWTSPSVSVGEDIIAILDINTDASGDCSRSFLSTIVAGDSDVKRPF